MILDLNRHLPGKHADINDVTVPGCPRSYVYYYRARVMLDNEHSAVAH